MAVNSLFMGAMVSLPVIAAVEGVVLSRANPRRYEWRSYFASLGVMLGAHGFEAAVPWTLATPVMMWAWRHRLGGISIDSWASFLVLFVGTDFCFYWFHRASHRIRWLWASHVVHHSPNCVDLSIAYGSRRRRGSRGY